MGQDEEIRKKNQDLVSLEKDLRKAEKDKIDEAKRQREILNDKDILKKKKEELETILALEKDALSQKQRIVERVKENHETDVKKRSTMELQLKKKKNNIFRLNDDYIMLESKAKKLENQVK